MSAIEEVASRRRAQKQHEAIRERARNAGVSPYVTSDEVLVEFLRRVDSNPKLAAALKKAWKAEITVFLDSEFKISESGGYDYVDIDVGKSDEEIIRFLVG